MLAYHIVHMSSLRSSSFLPFLCNRNETWQEPKLQLVLIVLYQVCGLFWLIKEPRWPPWPLIGRDIFDFFSMGTNIVPSSSRHISLFIWSRIYTAFALNRKETVGIWGISVHRYIDDLLTINNPEFENYPSQVYPVELEIKDTTESNTSVLPRFTSFDREPGRSTSYFHLWQTWRFDFNFHITNFQFLSSNIPALSASDVFISQLIRYARTCSSYGCFILRATRLSNKLLEQGYAKERLESSLMKFYDRYRDLINNKRDFYSDEYTILKRI